MKNLFHDLLNIYPNRDPRWALDLHKYQDNCRIYIDEYEEPEQPAFTWATQPLTIGQI